ncbi:unnamed protein product, partial [Pylaiella littoralis]
FTVCSRIASPSLLSNAMVCVCKCAASSHFVLDASLHLLNTEHLGLRVGLDLLKENQHVFVCVIPSCDSVCVCRQLNESYPLAFMVGAPGLISISQRSLSRSSL